MTSFLIVKNNAISTLAAGVNDSETAWTVATGEGALFPSTFPFDLTIENEIVRCTARSTDAITVVRAQQGTAAASHGSGISVKLQITAKHLDDLTEIFTSDKMVTFEETVISHEGNVVFN
jgi:hypothetical protein